MDIRIFLVMGNVSKSKPKKMSLESIKLILMATEGIQGHIF